MSLVKWTILGLLVLPFAEIVAFVVVAVELGLACGDCSLMLRRHSPDCWCCATPGSAVCAHAHGVGERRISRVALDGRGS